MATLTELFWADLVARFWKHVEKADDDGCWLWRGSRSPNGYGKIRVAGRHLLAHRVSWEMEYGEGSDGIPSGKQICHRCDNPGCVRPDHLFVCTQSENILDAHAKGRAVPPRAGMQGERHHQARLTEERVLEARGLYATGDHRLIDLATKYGVGVSTIHDAVAGKKWKHLPLVHRIQRYEGSGAPAAVHAD